MRIAYFDCFSGISGDMTVGALVAAGLPMEHLTTELQKLPLAGYRISSRIIERSMISSTKFDVEILMSEDGIAPANNHTHSHDGHSHHEHSHHEHSHDGHSHDHAHAHSHSHDHEETSEIHVHTHGLSYHDIRHLIADSTLSTPVKTRAVAIFTAIAEAEAKIHNVPLMKVHFHEVGSIDSIVDIVATAIGLEYFGVEECRSRVVPLGAGGMIRTAHGIMPIPTPATLEIMRGYPTELGKVETELTTPTGAGIIKAMSKGLLSSSDSLIPVAVGYGAGTKDFKEIPNLLRVVIADLAQESNGRSNPGESFTDRDEVIQLTTAIDDMTPMNLSYVQELLLEAGALDVYLRPIHMKKGRSAQELLVLVSSDKAEAILNILERETTTLGVRYERLQRRIAKREIEERHHPLGLVHVKYSTRGGLLRHELEYEDVKRISREKGLPFRELYDQLRRDLLDPNES